KAPHSHVQSRISDVKYFTDRERRQEQIACRYRVGSRLRSGHTREMLSATAGEKLWTNRQWGVRRSALEHGHCGRPIRKPSNREQHERLRLHVSTISLDADAYQKAPATVGRFVVHSSDPF